MTLFNNLRNWLSLGILVGSLITANSDDTNRPILKITKDPLKVVVDRTVAIRRYDLLTKTNLTNEWENLNSAHGTGTNLDFNINDSSPVRFYKTVSIEEPIAPTNASKVYGLSYEKAQRGQGPGTTFSNNLSIVNYDTVPLAVNVNWTETYNRYGGSAYTVNAPFNQTLQPGTNLVPAVFVWQCNDGGAMVSGDWSLEINP